MPGARSDQSAERARIQVEIEKLEAKRRELGLALGEFEHDARRLRDALERLGGRSVELEARVKTLRKNQKLTEEDLEANAKALDRLNRRLTKITFQIEN